jgi:hypothetical protein
MEENQGVTSGQHDFNRGPQLTQMFLPRAPLPACVTTSPVHSASMPDVVLKRAHIVTCSDDTLAPKSHFSKKFGVSEDLR